MPSEYKMGVAHRVTEGVQQVLSGNDVQIKKQFS